MNEHVMAKTLSGTINAISGGGGNGYNVLLHVNAATLRGLTSFILCLIYLNAKETQPFSNHFFFHMDHMRLIS